MSLMNVFKTTTFVDSPLNASKDAGTTLTVSDFITVQSFANFAVMTGAITAAWQALQRLTPTASGIWVPYLFSFAWAIISFLISVNDLKKASGEKGHLGLGTLVGAAFIALINSLVLAGAVVGTNIAASQNP